MWQAGFQLHNAWIILSFFISSILIHRGRSLIFVENESSLAFSKYSKSTQRENGLLSVFQKCTFIF